MGKKFVEEANFRNNLDFLLIMGNRQIDLSRAYVLERLNLLKDGKGVLQPNYDQNFDEDYLSDIEVLVLFLKKSLENGEHNSLIL